MVLALVMQLGSDFLLARMWRLQVLLQAMGPWSLDSSRLVQKLTEMGAGDLSRVL